MGFVPDPPPPAAQAGDAPTPDLMARKAAEAGVQKAARDLSSLLALAVLAGAFIALGGLFSTVATAGAAGLPYGIAKLVGGLVFSLGLVLVTVAGAQLFTGDTLMVMAWASKRLRLSQMARVWALVWLGNLAGAVGTALLVYWSGHWQFGHGAFGANALAIAAHKAALPFGQAFVLGILCNVLVCLGVWMSYAARSVTDKVLAVMLPVAAFVAAGFEHCVANMYFIPLGMLIRWGAPAGFWADLGTQPPEITWAGLAGNLGAVTLGNAVGGALFVGAAYWFIYLRKDARA